MPAGDIAETTYWRDTHTDARTEDKNTIPPPLFNGDGGIIKKALQSKQTIE